VPITVGYVTSRELARVSVEESAALLIVFSLSDVSHRLLAWPAQGGVEALAVRRCQVHRRVVGGCRSVYHLKGSALCWLPPASALAVG